MTADASNGSDMPMTYGSGPSEPLRLGDEPGTWVEVAVNAPVDRVWDLVTDISLPARFSDEFLGASWADDRGPSVGAVFHGRNHHEAIGEWEVPAFVEAYDPGRSFGWSTIDPDDPGSRWRFDLSPEGEGTRLRYSMSIGPGPSGITIAIKARPEKEPRILQRRIAEHYTNMCRTVDGIRELAEAQT